MGSSDVLLIANTEAKVRFDNTRVACPGGFFEKYFFFYFRSRARAGVAHLEKLGLSAMLG
jgi:hypothetical protein